MSAATGEPVGTLPAGARPSDFGKRRTRNVVLGVVAGICALILVCGGLSAAYFTFFSHGTPDLPGGKGKDTTNGPVDLVSADQVDVAASSVSGEKVAANVQDRDPATYWSAQPRVDQPDEKPRLTFTMRDPAGVKLRKLELLVGADGDEYDRRPRPARICVYLDGGDCQKHELEDTPEAQEVGLKGSKAVHEVVVEVVTVYPARTPGDLRDRVTIREVKLLAAK